MKQTDAAAMAAGIPGLVIRPYAGEADLPEVARVQSAEWTADGVSERAVRCGQRRSARIRCRVS